MKSLFFAISLLTALGTAHASSSQPMASLGLGQNLGQPTLVAALNTGSSDNKPVRSQPQMAATPPTQDDTVEGAGFELESGLLLALAGVMALLIISSRRQAR